jgi:hypothetical protein
VVSAGCAQEGEDPEGPSLGGKADVACEEGDEDCLTEESDPGPSLEELIGIYEGLDNEDDDCRLEILQEDERLLATSSYTDESLYYLEACRDNEENWCGSFYRETSAFSFWPRQHRHFIEILPDLETGLPSGFEYTYQKVVNGGDYELLEEYSLTCTF